jgi:hypothetical protein
MTVGTQQLTLLQLYDNPLPREEAHFVPHKLFSRRVCMVKLKCGMVGGVATVSATPTKICNGFHLPFGPPLLAIGVETTLAV